MYGGAEAESDINVWTETSEIRHVILDTNVDLDLDLDPDLDVLWAQMSELRCLSQDFLSEPRRLSLDFLSGIRRLSQHS